ncbi:MAG: ABC transporter substrate-binding protein [Chloroflexota bacterium]
MSIQHQTSAPAAWSNRQISRRSVLRTGLLALAAVPLVAACGQGQSSGTGTSSQQAPTSKSASRTLRVVQTRDFHPDHNAYIEQQIREFARQKDYDLDHSYVEGYAGSGNIVQKLTAGVQAGDAPDVMTHTLRPAELKFLGVIDQVDELQKELISEYGKALPAMERRALLDGQWWAVQHFSRAGGYFARSQPFAGIGVDIHNDLGTLDAVREAALRVSDPGQERWGWGMTPNRSGDGETTVRNLVMLSGGQLVDETGQLVVLNNEPYRQHAIDGLTWLKDVYTSPHWAPMVPTGISAWTDPSNNEAFLAGKILFTNNAGTVYAKAVFDKNPVADDTYMLETPKGVGPGGRALQGADGMRWFIMKGARNRQGGEELIRHMLSPDVQRQIFTTSTGYAYPAYEWGWDEAVITDNQYAQHVTPQWRDVAFDPSGFTEGEWPGPPTPWTASLESSNFWTDMFGEVLGGKPVPQAVADAHMRAVRVFKEFGAQGA